MNVGFLLDFFDPQFVNQLKKIEGQVRHLSTYYVMCIMQKYYLPPPFTLTLPFTDKEANVELSYLPKIHTLNSWIIGLFEWNKNNLRENT